MSSNQPQADRLELEEASTDSSHLPLIAAFVFYALLLFLALPQTILLRNDDFGYFDNFVKSLSLGKIVTSDFLEPHAAAHTLLSVSVYRLTHSVWWASYGMLYLTNLVLWFTLWRLAARKESPLVGAWIATAILCFPLVFAKSLEFTSIPLYWVGFFSFLLLWKNRPLAAGLAFAVAYGSRQSALALLVLPGLDILRCIFLSQPNRLRNALVSSSTVLIIFCLLFAFALTSYMNVTFAQANITRVIFQNFRWGPFVSTLLAFALFYFASLGLSLALDRVRRQGLLDFLRPMLKEPSRWIVFALFSLIMTLTIKPWNNWLGLDMAYLGAIPHVDFFIFVGLLVFSFVLPLGRSLYDLPYLGLAAVVGLLYSLRNVIWDYYTIEILILGALSLNLSPPSLGHRANKRTVNFRRFFPAICIVAIYFLMTLVYALALKGLNEKIWLRSKLYEQAIRSHRISIHEVSNAPFGYLGWKLFETKMKEQKNRGQFLGLAHLLCEIDGSASLVELVPHSYRATVTCRADEADSFRVVDMVEGSVYWQKVSMQLLLPCSYQKEMKNTSICENLGEPLALQDFPLSEAEWSNYIDSAGSGLL